MTDKGMIRKLAAEIADAAVDLDREARNLAHTDAVPLAVVELKLATQRVLAARNAIKEAVRQQQQTMSH